MSFLDVRCCAAPHVPFLPALSHCETESVFSRRHERSGVTAAHVDAYRSAQLVRGWERGLLRFLMARVSGTRFYYQCSFSAAR